MSNAVTIMVGEELEYSARYYNSEREEAKCHDPCMGELQVPLCSLPDVQLRFLCPNDLNEVQTLCEDWFPIDYPLSWYEDITSSTRFFALAAVYNQIIIGLIVAEIKPFLNVNHEDEAILAPAFAKTADVGYIMSLGVSKEFRRNGIASLLLDSLINHLTTSERKKVKAVFLHVLTSNTEAILFYEHRKFRLHCFLPYYYSIRGRSKDGFTYVLYINGGHPPWAVYDYIKYWCSVVWKGGGFCSRLFKSVAGFVNWLWPSPAASVANACPHSTL